MSENAKQYAALLGAKAQEASSYVQLLSADLVSAEGRANQEREKLALLRREYFRGSRMEAEAWRKQQILRGEEEEGVRAVKVNEAAFRSDVQRYAGDHHAIGVGTPKLGETQGVANASW